MTREVEDKTKRGRRAKCVVLDSPLFPSPPPYKRPAIIGAREFTDIADSQTSARDIRR